VDSRIWYLTDIHLGFVLSRMCNVGIGDLTTGRKAQQILDRMGFSRWRITRMSIWKFEIP
jgi:hypothetical protein